MRLILIWLLFAGLLSAQNSTQAPQVKKRWVLAWTSCAQVLAFFSPVVPAFMIYTQKVYRKTAGDELDHDTAVVLKIAALGTALSSVLMVTAYLPDCVCRICESASSDGTCTGC